jgi:orotate phosphoribosyltransferase-like protein
MKLHILKVTDRDSSSDDMYYTIKGLRDQVLNEWYDVWETMPQEDFKEQLRTSDEHLFDYMNSWNFNVEIILTITENDIPKRSNVIEVDVAFYHPDDDETIKVYDIEGMTQEFDNKLSNIINNN